MYLHTYQVLLLGGSLRDTVRQLNWHNQAPGAFGKRYPQSKSIKKALDRKN